MIICDRCGRECVEGTAWGNCTECGDDICAACSAGFDEYGVCGECAEKEAKEAGTHADQT